MCAKKIIVSKVVKGSIIGFTIVTLLMPGVLSACSSKKDGLATNTMAEKETKEIKAVELKDISGNWAEVTIRSLVSKGVIVGETDGSYLPDKPATRAEFLTLVVKQEFGNDIPKGKEWYTGYYLKAKGAGWLPRDYSDIELQSEMSRGEMAYIINAKQKLKDMDNYSMTDVEGTEYAKAIKNCIATNFLAGYPEGTFGPEKSMTKAELATVISRIYMTEKERLGSTKLSPDGRLLRTTNLPFNADDYEYILADLSNDWYTQRDYINANWFDTSKGGVADVVSYKEVAATSQLTLPKDFKTKDFYGNDVYLKIINNAVDMKIITDRQIENLTLRTNVDYKTIDYAWADKLLNTMYGGVNPSQLTTYETAKKDVYDYVDYVKVHKIIVKSNKIQVEPSLTYGRPMTGQPTYMFIFASYIDFEITQWENINNNDYYRAVYGSESNTKSYNTLLGVGKYSRYVDRYSTRKSKESTAFSAGDMTTTYDGGILK